MGSLAIRRSPGSELSEEEDRVLLAPPDGGSPMAADARLEHRR